MAKISVLFLVFLAVSVSASAQTLYMYSSWTIDDSTGNVALYGRTSTDYTTGYYYDVSVGLTLFLNDSNTYACNVESSEVNMDAEQSCSYTVPLGESVTFDTYHEIDATYYWNQLFPSCSYGCYDFADYYGFSLLPGDGGTYSDNETFFAPGQAAQIPQRKSKSGRINRNAQVGACQYPTGESCGSQGFDPQNQYVAQFLQGLQGGQFSQRIVQEY